MGLDHSKFKDTGAAVTHHDCSDDPTQFPRMFWPTNMSRLACLTMFTVFFGGERFAPDLKVEGESMQHYLHGARAG